MPKMSPQQFAAKWASKVTGSTEAYKSGVQNVRENPAAKAIAAKQLWIDNLNQAAQDGRFEAGLSQVTLSGWQAACAEKGAANIAAGARAGVVKVQRAEQILGPQRDAIVASLPPRGTADQNIERAVAMMRGMMALRKKG